MIQRIQTIWLFICLVLSIFLFNGRMAEFIGQNNEKLSLGLKGLYLDSADGIQVINHTFPLLPAILIIPVFSFLGIILFRKRSLQKIAVIIVITGSVLFCLECAWYWNFAIRTYAAHIIPGFRMILPVIIIILAILAFLAIGKDEDLVKSYDRLR